MGDINTGTQKSGLSNPAMEAAATTIGNKLNTQLGVGVKPYDQSMVPALSGQTQAGINSIMGAAGNTGGITAANNWAQGTVNSGGYNDALRSAGTGVKGFLAESQANAPGYAALRANLIDDVTTASNATFQGSGRFGSASHQENFNEGLGTALAGMDMQNYENRLGRSLAGNQALAGIGQTAMGNAGGAAAALPGFYQAGLMPGGAMLQAGQIQDTWNTAKAQDDARRFDATQNAGWNDLQRGSAIFAGTAPVSGTTTTQSQPWWKVGTGLAASAFGMM